jgi:hypothetical protein
MIIDIKNKIQFDTSSSIAIMGKKFFWIIILILIDLIILTIFKTGSISLSLDKGIFFQIPIAYWIEISIIFPVLYVASKFANRRWEILVLVLLFFFVIYSSNLFLVIPYQQTDRSIFRYAEIMRNTSYIGQNEISLDAYFQWPVFFLFLKMLDLTLNTTLNHLITFGLFTFGILLPIFFSFFLDKEIDLRVLFLVPIIYVLVSYHFIVNQFAPQTMGLLFLILIFGLYYRYGFDLRFRFLLILLFFTLVFTHPFTFLFFFGSVLMEYSYTSFFKKTDFDPRLNKRITIDLILLFVTIYCFGLIYHFWVITGRVKQLVHALGLGVGEGITPIRNFMGVNSVHSSSHPLYRLVPEFYSKLFSNSSRVALILFVVVFLIGLAIKRKNISINIIDICTIVFNTGLFAIGLVSVFLGQRSLQIIVLPISKLYGGLINQSKTISAVVGILIVISPTLFIITSIINISIDGGTFIQDDEMDYAGQFVDRVAISSQHVFRNANSYPTGYPENFTIFADNRNLTGVDIDYMDIILNSPKSKLINEYFGTSIENIYKEIIYKDTRPDQIYDNGYTTSIFNAREKQ